MPLLYKGPVEGIKRISEELNNALFCKCWICSSSPDKMNNYFFFLEIHIIALTRMSPKIDFL